MQPKSKQPSAGKSDQTMQILDFLRENIPGEGDAAEEDQALDEAKKKVKKRKDMMDEPIEPGTMPQMVTGGQ